MSRDLLNRSKVLVGIDQRIWQVLETGGFGNLATGGLFPAAANGIEHTAANIEFHIPRENAAHRSGRSVVTRLNGKKEAKWTFEAHIVPKAPVGGNPQLPDSHAMLLSVFGAVDTSNPAQIVYKLNRSTSASFRMLEEGTHFSRLCVGCVTDNASFMLPGDGKAQMKLDGFAQDAFLAAQSAVVSAVPGATTGTITLTAGQGGRFDVGSYIDVIDGTDGNTRKIAAALVTGVAGDVLSYSLAGGPFATSPGDIVVGAAPDFTATSTAFALLGLRGSFSTSLLGTIDADLLSAEISIKNQYTTRMNSYGKDYMTGFIADKRRTVAVKLEVLLTKDNFEFYSNNRKFLVDNLTIVLQPQLPTSPTGQTWTFNLPKVEFMIPKLEQPNDNYVKLTLEGTAFATDINNVNNELTLTLT